MTTPQVKTILSEIGGYSTDMIIPLTEVTAIVLESNENIYPDDTTHVYFDSTYDLMLVYYGETKNGVFTPESKPRFIIELESVQGFYLSNKYRHKSPYSIGGTL